MKIRTRFMPAFIAICLIAVPAAHAARMSVNSSTHAVFNIKSKAVKISFRNDTKAALELKIGTDVVTLQAGKVATMKLPAGTRIIANTTTEHLAVGDLIVEVTDSMYSDATFVIR
jgi:hypothetical protein